MLLVRFLSLTAALLASLVSSQYTLPTIVGNGSTVLSNGKYEISSEGIRANFIPYGAAISNMFITDVHGIERDIVVGFDNASYYSIDGKHPHLGPIVGRYANRTLSSFNWVVCDRQLTA